MQALDIMTKPVVSVTPDTTIEEAINLMLDRHISGVPVVDPQGKLVGMATEGDLLRRSEIGTQIKRSRWLGFFLSPGRLAEEYVHTRGRRVGDVMTRTPHTAIGTASLADVVDLMVRHGIKRVPIVSEGVVIGVVTRSDVLRSLASALKLQPSFQPLDDIYIRDAIRAAFEQSHCIPTSLIDVSVKEGVVTLRGSITDERERAAVDVAIRSVPGVTEIHDHLAWIAPMSGMVLLSPADDTAERDRPAAA